MPGVVRSPQAMKVISPAMEFSTFRPKIGSIFLCRGAVLFHFLCLFICFAFILRFPRFYFLFFTPDFKPCSSFLLYFLFQHFCMILRIVRATDPFSRSENSHDYKFSFRSKVANCRSKFCSAKFQISPKSTMCEPWPNTLNFWTYGCKF